MFGQGRECDTGKTTENGKKYLFKNLFKVLDSKLFPCYYDVNRNDYYLMRSAEGHNRSRIPKSEYPPIKN